MQEQRRKHWEVLNEQAGYPAFRPFRPFQVAGAIEWHAGAGAVDADAKGARCGGGAAHGRLCHRLSRLAFGCGRYADGARQARVGGGGCAVSTRPERGSCRHRDLGNPAGGTAWRGEVRRRVCTLVWQGAGGGPLWRRDAPRQYGRHLAQGRRADGDGGRPHGGVIDHAAPVRLGDGGCLYADRLARRGAGIDGLRPLRLGFVALCRGLGRAQDDEGYCRGDLGCEWQSAPAVLRDAGFQAAAGRGEYPPDRHPRAARSADDRLQEVRRRSVCAG
ncbi:hypothetical protein GALL_424900 [mine drainage metagenome]|uniref:Uncharacterized protein n=1 Tax=mine drainage metagenome TaxID=410659 RepID=A0A1J5Q755_9ZZZZ